MKKFLSLFLVVVMLFSLVACGANESNTTPNDNPGTSQPENSDTTNPPETPDTSEPPSTDETPGSNEVVVESKFDWVIRNVARPDDKIVMNVIKRSILSEYLEKEYNQTLTVSNLSHYNVTDIKAQLAQNDFIKNKYVLGISHDEETYHEIYTDAGLCKRYHYSDSVVGVLKDEDATTNSLNDIMIRYSGDTNDATGYTSVSALFYGVNVTKANQTDLLTVLEMCMPKDVAYYLVYAQDDDGKTISNKSLNDAKELGVEFQDDNHIYYLKREFYVSKYDEADNYVRFSYGISDTLFNNTYKFYDGDYKPHNDDMKYLPAEFFGEQVGNTDFINNPTAFFDTYFNTGSKNYSGTALQSGWYWLTHTVGDNGVNIYSVRMDITGFNKDENMLTSPGLEMSYTVRERDGKTVAIEYLMEGTSSHIDDSANVTTSHKQLCESLLKQMQLLLGRDADLSALTFDNLKVVNEQKREGSTTVQTTLAGLDKNINVTLSLGRSSAMYTWKGSFKLSVSL